MRRDERFGEIGERAVPAAHGGTRELEAVTRVHAFETVQWHVILPAPDDRVGEHAGPGEATRNRQLQGLGDEDLGELVTLTAFEHELRSYDASHDERCRAALDHFAHVLADALECIEPLSVHLGWQHLDDDTREVLRQRLTSGRWTARVGLYLLLGIRRRESRVELGALTLSQHHREHVERELRAVRQVLGLRGEEA